MTRDDLTRILVDKQGNVPYKVMSQVVKQLLENLSSGLKKNDRIEIRGFGSFVLRQRPARLARNPKTGEQLLTKQKLAVHFKPGKELKERVNHAT